MSWQSVRSALYAIIMVFTWFMNGDMDREHVTSATRADSKIPIWNFGRGVVTLFDPPGVVTAVSSGEESSGVSSLTLASVMVWAREKGLVGALSPLNGNGLPSIPSQVVVELADPGSRDNTRERKLLVGRGLRCHAVWVQDPIQLRSIARDKRAAFRRTEENRLMAKTTERAKRWRLDCIELTKNSRINSTKSSENEPGRKRSPAVAEDNPFYPSVRHRNQLKLRRMGFRRQLI